MKKSDFYYDLPEEYIAQKPVTPRDHSKLLIYDRKNDTIQHKRFYEIIDYLEEGDCLVLNDTKVIPARLFGEKKDTGAKIEFVLLKEIETKKWEVMLRPGRKAKIGSRFVFGNGLLEAEITDIVEGGNRIVSFECEGLMENVLEKIGQMPLPPYIKSKLEDTERYQTVYAKYAGSAAAPTAGLHFTEELLEKIQKKGISIVYLTLHVGLGTFRPVKTENIEDHKMHTERFTIGKNTCDVINRTKTEKKHVICVGTTCCRVLESVADENGHVRPVTGETDIFIYPGYRFKAVDRLVTNFHLPESTLLMLVSAFAGKENIMTCYKEAIEKNYRFFSFGDAMFIL
ncbi:MAG: tRNA preQ1(34) S-adenosylmethionine ribosyltransferase-isomerase QueA [Clostridia bacterium]|jgi:S-adenosylmethionine:tRNA ribosyltransferase-isomerase|nr:tRNA preQ1(34) S-adenosylmethionine ribosyltransferase-isomerase QueA [Clostridiaceae bacterium]